MCKFCLKSNDGDSSKFNASYIGHYYFCSTCITGLLFVIVVIISLFIINSLQDYQKYIVLFTDVFFALLFVISLIAMFREISRLHAREFPTDTIDRVNEIEKRLQTIEDRVNEIEKRLQTIEDRVNDIEKRLQTIEKDKETKVSHPF